MKPYRDWKLTSKLTIPVGAVLLVGAIGAGTLIYQQRMRQVRDQAGKMAHALTLQIAEDRTYYTANVLGKLKKDGIAITAADSRFRDQPGAIPLPATFVKEVTEVINKKGFYKADLISGWPINKEKGPRTPFEREAFAAVVKDPETPREAMVDEGGQARLLYVSADVAGAQACVSCHNAHPDSPKKDFKLGDVMGALVVEIPVAAEIAAARAEAGMMIGGMAFVLLLLLGTLFAITRRFIQQPVGAITPIFQQMAQGGGDLTVRLRVTGEDEVGQLSRWFNTFMDKLQEVMRQVRRSAEQLSSASQELSAGSGQLSSGAQGQAASLEETAASLEEITGTVKQNADNAKQASQLAMGSRDVAEKGGQVVADGGPIDEGDQPVVEEDRGHHHDDRRDRVPDEPAGAERGGGSGAGGRAGAGVRGGGGGGAEPGAAERDGGEGDQGADPGQRGEGGGGVGAGEPVGGDADGDRGVGEAGDGHHRGDRGGVAGADDGDRPGERGGDADGPGDAGERGADGGAELDGAGAGGAGGGAAGAGRAVQSRRRRSRRRDEPGPGDRARGAAFVGDAAAGGAGAAGDGRRAGAGAEDGRGADAGGAGGRQWQGAAQGRRVRGVLGRWSNWIRCRARANEAERGESTVTKLLTNVKMRTKLGLMLLCPLLAVLYFSVSGVWEKWTQVKEMEALLALSELAVKTSALVHESQKERGMTALFLGSKGTKFQAELSGQRAETDTRIGAFTEHLRAMDGRRFGRPFETSVTDAQTRLDRTASTREAATAMSIPAAEAIGHYTALNAALLGVISRATHQSGEGELVRRLTAYVSFLQAKERTGIERALLSNTFAQDAFGPGMYERFLAVVAAQETYAATFESLSSDADREFSRKTIAGAASDEVARIRKLAIENAATGKFGIEAGHWFKTMTDKINSMKEVENRLSEGLVAQAEALRKHATAALALFLGIGVVALGGP